MKQVTLSLEAYQKTIINNTIMTFDEKLKLFCKILNYSDNKLATRNNKYMFSFVHCI